MTRLRNKKTVGSGRLEMVRNFFYAVSLTESNLSLQKHRILGKSFSLKKYIKV